ncbi:MAG: S-methyl-5'-thioadenosine phosphorylase [Mariprofundales bacterium]
MRTGIIGGSGLYAIDGAEVIEQFSVDTPFGTPSDNLTVVRICGQEVVFLPRHGSGHHLPPHKINYRANIHALKQVGVQRIISISAVGSLREHIKPGDFVIVDQFVDRTRERASTFFDGPVVAHVSMADPVCSQLSQSLSQACINTGITIHNGGTYLAMQGPQFSTRAESKLYRSWGMQVIGMTNMPEAKLAREAEICYATVAMSTDYDCWHEEEEDVTVTSILEIMHGNVAKAKRMLLDFFQSSVDNTDKDCPDGCNSVLNTAGISDLQKCSAQELEKVKLLLGKERLP